MKAFPDTKRVEELRKHVSLVAVQRVEHLRKLAEIYRMPSWPVRIEGGYVAQVAFTFEFAYDVLMKRGEGGSWRAIAEWGHDDKAAFVAGYDVLSESYADDVCRAYDAMEACELWKQPE